MIHQIMKYVDWVNQEYSNSYDMIEAFIVAKEFSNEVIELKSKIAKRVYTKGRRQAITVEWSNLRLIKYTYEPNSKSIVFEEILV